ncbi:hypothetical protein L3X38_020871 [Prunus dulcis]|uniref:Iron hydrogenase small subunit domain-containing protein n=1 Tax=Prunus dulcis TaxID=3755 RepID=A0AAD4Z2T8_PRUDU|nr:hypothetical protein L3X38_020871 [Prunus dulcis]
MSEKFSATLRIGDLNDFIAPSQACIVSLKGLKASSTKPSAKPEVSTSSKQLKQKPVKISLKDCLACSGCVTSAETVMLEKQSLDEFLFNIDKGKAVIVSYLLNQELHLPCILEFHHFRSLGNSRLFLSHWVRICYAEKQLGSYVLPYISSVKSPQQTIGVIVKNNICQKMGLRPLMCTMVSEVDSVLTSGEVLELIQLKGVDFKGLEESSLDGMLTNFNEGHLYGVQGSSGGYAETIFRYAGKVLFGREVKGPVDFRTIKNSDFQEVTLEVEGKTVLKFALCYGFRNLQNIVRKIKIGKCDYHFLEIMACPSGCLNGGGQVKPQPGQSAKELIQLLQTAYMENVLIADPFGNPLVQSLYDEWLEHPGSEKAKRLFHTDYHPVVKSISSQLHNW